MFAAELQETSRDSQSAEKDNDAVDVPGISKDSIFRLADDMEEYDIAQECKNLVNGTGSEDVEEAGLKQFLDFRQYITHCVFLIYIKTHIYYHKFVWVYRRKD